MSRFLEVLQLKTAEEREAWWDSLSDVEREEISQDVHKIMEGLTDFFERVQAAFTPIFLAFQEWAVVLFVEQPIVQNPAVYSWGERAARCMRCRRVHPTYKFSPAQLCYVLHCENCGTQMHEPIPEDYGHPCAN